MINELNEMLQKLCKTYLLSDPLLHLSLVQNNFSKENVCKILNSLLKNIFAILCSEKITKMEDITLTSTSQLLLTLTLNQKTLNFFPLLSFSSTKQCGLLDFVSALNNQLLNQTLISPFTKNLILKSFSLIASILGDSTCSVLQSFSNHLFLKYNFLTKPFSEVKFLHFLLIKIIIHFTEQHPKFRLFLHRFNEVNNQFFFLVI